MKHLLAGLTLAVLTPALTWAGTFSCQQDADCAPGAFCAFGLNA